MMVDLRFAICDLRLNAPEDLARARGRANRKSQIANRKFPRGFSFAEVMFAVIVLGVGFIMVAAIFPVAIQQTKSTADDTHAAAGAREAANNFQQSAAYRNDMPALTPTTLPSPSDHYPPNTTVVIPGQVYSLRDPQPSSYSSPFDVTLTTY